MAVEQIVPYNKRTITILRNYKLILHIFCIYSSASILSSDIFDVIDTSLDTLSLSGKFIFPMDQTEIFFTDVFTQSCLFSTCCILDVFYVSSTTVLECPACI